MMSLGWLTLSLRRASWDDRGVKEMKTKWEGPYPGKEGMTAVLTRFEASGACDTASPGGLR